MGWRGTAVLALLVLFTAAYLCFEQPPQDTPATRALVFGTPPAPPPTRSAQRLLDFAPADVVTVSLEHEGVVRQTERVGGTWQGPSRPGAIDDFLHTLADLGVLMDLSADVVDLKDYGLQPPRSVLQLQLRHHSQPLVLQIGDRNPATTGVYVRIGNTGPVVLAGALVAWEFDIAFKSLGGTGGGG
jgi:hypothetical protein